jgi:hypothetical protein
MKTLNADVFVGRCSDGHFVAQVTFKNAEGNTVFESRSPCFDTFEECEKASLAFCEMMAPVVLQGPAAIDSWFKHQQPAQQVH